jgi:hypothetical protein
MIDRYFVIMSIGHSGSAWLAKLLNSHFDVMCFHELECVTYGEGIPPRIRAFHEFTADEALRNLMYLFSPSHRYGDAYKALGTVDGALDIGVTMAQIAATFPAAHAKTSYYLLLRNPVSQIHSRAERFLQMPPPMRSSVLAASLPKITSALSNLELPLRAALSSHLQVGNDDLQFFIHTCLGYLGLLQSVPILEKHTGSQPVLQLERLTQDPAYLQATLQQITGFEYSLDLRALQKVNVKAGAHSPQTLWDFWHEERRRVFLMIFERCPGLLKQAGYELDTLLTPESFAGLEEPTAALASPSTLDELQRRWMTSDAALRDTRSQLTRAITALSDLRAEYEQARRKAELVDDVGPRSLQLARHLKHVWNGCRRTLGMLDSIARAPQQLLRLSSDEGMEARRAA